jgi:hypothetical protein
MFWAQGNMSADRNIKMAIASSAPLPGTEVDNLLTVDISADASMQPAMQVIKLQNILFEYAPKGKDNINDLSVRVRVYALGDNDRNDDVNVADAVNMIANILGTSSDVEYNIMLSDMNGDKVIDIFDVMKLKHVILNGKLPEKKEAMARAAEHRIYEDMTLAFARKGVTIGFPNAQRFSAFQFEVVVPDGTELTSAQLIGMATNHQVEFAKIDDNTYRVIALSTDNSLLESGNGNDLIGLEIPDCGKVSIRRALCVTPRGEVTYFNNLDKEDGITGIDGITVASQNGTAYDLLGRKVEPQNGRLPKGIYIINNKRVIVK